MREPLSFSPIKLALSRRLGQDADQATTLEAEHRLVESALEQIEALADALPQLPQQATLEFMIANLRDGIPAHCRHEEVALAESDSPAVERALRMLKSEHAANAAIGAELAELLEDCVTDQVAANPETLGQLARQYFMLMRRHMAWEEYLIDALLTPALDDQN